MRIGSLFSGYGGLEQGVQAVLGGSTAWVSDIDPGACRILAHRYPDVPNLGDISKVDWSQVEPVDVLTGGFPCQDVSAAGKRAGIRPGTRSGLWSQFAYAIGQLRPGLVVIENVRGLLSATAHSDVEPCPWCMGDTEQRGPALRALGAVLGDLAVLGYDAQWHGLRAADVGAPHGRFRVFIVAYPRRRDGRGPASLTGGASGWRPADQSSRSTALAPHADILGHKRGRATRDGWAGPADGSLLPTPTARDWKDGGPVDAVGTNGLLGRAVWPGRLLPTPAVNDMGEGKTVDRWDEWTATMQAKHGNGNGHGKSLAIEAQRLLPTPKAHDGEFGTPRTSGRPPEMATHLATAVEFNITRNETRWGDYAPAIARWEHALGRPAPAPTEPGPKGSPRLSPAFVEWMMGLPAGWVTDAPGLTRNQQLKALGNGVVPQQAAAALRLMLATERAA